MTKVAVVIGTRPEAIKLAPVVRKLEACSGTRPLVVSTGQHREMLHQMLEVFGIAADVDLAAMSTKQQLSDLTAVMVSRLGNLFRAQQPDAVVVQGDTTTAFCAALAAFYEGIHVGHVEAGLRTGDIRSPFPEEANRALISPLAEWHFCPTETAQENLVCEGIDESRTFVTGNTVIDSLNWAVRQQGVKVPPKRRRRRAVVTLHRRENQGESMRAIAAAIAKLAARGDLEILFPLHMSPAVRAAIVPLLDGVEGVHLCEPLDYLTFSHTLASSDLVLTDSGGLQEEAPSLGIPVLVLRDTTERPEAVGAGVARLVGTNPQVIYDETVRLLEDEQMYREMATRANPYGDGHAAERIVGVISDRLESGALVA